MGSVGMDERDLEAEQASARLRVDQLRALALELSQRGGQIDNGVGDVVHPRPALREELPDRRLVAERVELLASLGDETPVGKFLAKRGPGMHHVAYSVADLPASLAELERQGAELIDPQPRQGLFGLEVAFVHPDAAHGVLAELVSDAG